MLPQLVLLPPLGHKEAIGTGKSFSEALILASTNPQYDKRLFMELPWKLQAQNMGRTWAEHVLPMFCP
jgi:hypothetical protein